MAMKYKWTPTGVGVIDNLGAQFGKIMRGANQGSIQTRWRYVEAGERFLKYIGPEFGLKKLQNIQDKHLEAYAKHLKNLGRVDKYIKNELSGIRYLHRQIPQARYELMDGTKANKLYSLGSTPDGRADRAWTDQEVKSMVELARLKGEPKVAQIIKAARATGMRLDEAASLRRHEVENALRTGTLQLTNTKGGRPRGITLSQTAQDALQRAIKDVPRGEYVFCPSDRKIHEFKKDVVDFIYLNRKEVQSQERLATGHNLAPGEKGALTFHGLRHAFARELYAEKLQNGFTREAALQKVAETLGHNRAEVSLIYIKATR